MHLFERLPSRSPIGRVRNRLRSIPSVAGSGSRTTSGSDATASDDEAASDVDAPGNLFHCPACAIVYIDAEKRTCSQCDGTVRQVRSTLSRR